MIDCSLVYEEHTTESTENTQKMSKAEENPTYFLI